MSHQTGLNRRTFLVGFHLFPLAPLTMETKWFDGEKITYIPAFNTFGWRGYKLPSHEDYDCIPDIRIFVKPLDYDFSVQIEHNRVTKKFTEHILRIYAWQSGELFSETIDRRFDPLSIKMYKENLKQWTPKMKSETGLKQIKV